MPLYRCPQNVKLIKMYIAAVFHLWQSNQAQNQSRLTLYVSLKSFARCHHQANQKNLPGFLCLPHGHREKRHQQKPSAVTGAALAVSVVFNNHWLELSFCWGQAAHLFLPAAPSPGICNSLQRARVSQCLTVNPGASMMRCRNFPTLWYAFADLFFLFFPGIRIFF